MDARPLCRLCVGLVALVCALALAACASPPPATPGLQPHVPEDAQGGEGAPGTKKLEDEKSSESKAGTPEEEEKARVMGSVGSAAPGGDPRALLLEEVGKIERLTSASYREDFGVEQGEPQEAPATSCEDLCDLDAAICESKVRICEIARRYPHEADFAERCTWASTQCDRAHQACEECEEP